MIPEFGYTFLLLALAMAAAAACLGLAKNTAFRALIRPACLLQCLFLTAAFLVLIYVHATSDFSVLNVAMNSHTLKPLLYKITGAWGNHEGSMLLWVWVLALYGVALAWLPQTRLRETALAIQGLLQTGLILYILFASNPFERLFPAPPEGMDLNPLLQDIGLAIHPPMLYLGYVGFGLAFCLTLAALLTGALDARFAKALKPWILIPWSLLTIGIGLGSWWAYRELGWGGYWFWDPVENASLLPWLAGTALIHANAVLEKRNTLRAWVPLLAIFTFSLSLIATFLVRSGVITSVHSFANDPARGIFILAYLFAVSGGALLVFTLKASTLRSETAIRPLSREGILVINNLFLVTACLSILLATLYPLAQEVLGMPPVTVGAPYFHKTFFPLLAPMMVLAGVALLVPWKHIHTRRLRIPLPVMFLATAFAVALVTRFVTPQHAWLLAGTALGVWTILGAVADLLQRRVHPPYHRYGVHVAHCGLGLLILAIAYSTLLKQEATVTLPLRQPVAALGYDFTLEAVRQGARENYAYQQGLVTARRGGNVVATLTPELRFYPVRDIPTTEAARDISWSRDLYLAPRAPAEAWWQHLDTLAKTMTVTVYVNPAMRWLWLAVLLMGSGGLLACLPSRGGKLHGRD